jgi:hypothetical protein
MDNSYLLTEDLFYLLLEDGGRIILNTGVSPSASISPSASPSPSFTENELLTNYYAVLTGAIYTDIYSIKNTAFNDTYSVKNTAFSDVYSNKGSQYIRKYPPVSCNPKNKT